MGDAVEKLLRDTVTAALRSRREVKRASLLVADAQLALVPDLL
jgi:hypothetical protein